MPELPEAETIRRQLEREVAGRTITAARAVTPRSVRRHPSCRNFNGCAVGKRITAVGRRGKAVILTLDDTDTLVVHLGMTGVVRVVPSTGRRSKHTHVVLSLDDGRRVHFDDMRKFGEVYVAQGTDWRRIPDLAKYGPEPLSSAFTRNYLRGALRGRSAKIKALLMDQTFLAGVGNIYSDEALWRARIHPERRADTLAAQEIARLHRAIRAVLRDAVARGGTSAQDETYRNVYGETGLFQLEAAVYQRTGQPCPRCGRAIERLPLAAGRAAHFCPRCQRGGRAARKM